MILHSLMAGLATFLFASFFLEYSFIFQTALVFVTIGAIGFHLITLAIELTTTHTTKDAHKVVEMITKGQFSSAFWFGMIIIGNFIPLIMLLTTENKIAAAASGIMIFVGLAIAQHIWVKAPQLIPLS